jgi:hypothetical protein
VWPRQRGVTGPFTLEARADDALRAAMVRVPALRRQECSGRLPLPALDRLTTAAGRPCAIWEWADGDVMGATDALDAETAAAVARALVHLHASFGVHGDLRPEHVVWTAAGPVLIDPLADLVTQGVGPLGWTLPVRANDPTLADVASLVQWIATSLGARLPWDPAFVTGIANLTNGRFSPWAHPLSRGTIAAIASAHGAALAGAPGAPARWALATLESLYVAVLGDGPRWTAQDSRASLARLIASG